MHVVPIANTNSIDAFVFILQLSAPLLTQDAAAINTTLGGKDGAFPAERGTRGFTVQFGPPGAPPPAPPLLLTRFRAKPDGTDAWTLQINGPTVSIACREYGSYSTVWKATQTFLSSVLQIAQTSRVVTEVTLQVVDRFQNIPDAGENLRDAYTPDAVFATNNPYLTPHVKDGGPLWHVHQGWFDQRDPQRMHQLNLGNMQVGTPPHYDTVIDYRGVVRGINTPAPVALDRIAGTFKALHDDNKAILKTLLTAQMQQKIGLNA